MKIQAGIQIISLVYTYFFVFWIVIIIIRSLIILIIIFNYVQEVEVNMIITDYCMPGMTGYDLLRKIKVLIITWCNFNIYYMKIKFSFNFGFVTGIKIIKRYTGGDNVIGECSIKNKQLFGARSWRVLPQTSSTIRPQ